MSKEYMRLVSMVGAVQRSLPLIPGWSLDVCSRVGG